MSSDKLWRSTKSRTDSGINSERISSSKGTNFLKNKSSAIKINNQNLNHNKDENTIKKDEELKEDKKEELTNKFEQIIEPNYVAEDLNAKNEN